MSSYTPATVTVESIGWAPAEPEAGKPPRFVATVVFTDPPPQEWTAQLVWDAVPFTLTPKQLHEEETP